MDLLKWIILGLCVVVITAQQAEPETSAEPSAEPEPEPESSPEPEAEPEPEDPPYYGTTIGELMNTAHLVSGALHVIDDERIMLTMFNYDGLGPDAYFYVGTSGNPSGNGFRLMDEDGTTNKLGEYEDSMVVLRIPDGVNMEDIEWFSVWCADAGANFGSIMFPGAIEVPMELDLGEFTTLAHDVRSGAVTILDHKRIRIENFYYDGEGPDAYFYIGTGAIQRNNTRVPNEFGSTEKLGEYDGATIILTLPRGFTVHNIEWLSVWCDRANVDFGNVMIPADILVPVHVQSMIWDDDMYLGEFVGRLNTLAHLVAGDVYVVDANRIRIVHFHYDGQGPDAYFYIGSDGIPSSSGMRVNNERNRADILMSYVDADIVLILPDGVTVSDILWFSVWCDEFGVDFGNILFPGEMVTLPMPAIVQGGFTELAHDVRSGRITFLDERRVQIMDLDYDGQGPDAFFWVGMGTPDGNGWPIPNHFGTFEKLEMLSGQTLVVTLPMGYTWYDVDYLSIWCRQAGADFGNVMVPHNVRLPPYVEMEETLANCQHMHEYFEVMWEIKGDRIHYEFIGALEGDNGYMAFGRSGSDSRSSMFNADALVGYWMNGQGRVDDYSLTNYAQCNVANGQGACPDNFVNNGVMNAEITKFRQLEGVTFISFNRPLMTGDAADLTTEMNMYIVWAMGVLGNDRRVTKHNIRLDDSTRLMEGDSCEGVQARRVENLEPWEQKSLYGDEITEFVAQIGPSGADRGYLAITGSQSWGIAWWINGYIIPEIIMERGTTYTFKVEGGNDLNNNAEYHPFYITDNSEGGYAQKSPAEKNRERVFAGIDSDGNATAAGRLCEWKPISGRDRANDFEDFSDYKETLMLECDEMGEPAWLEFTPDDDTPDTIFYQCYTHRYLGWEITVVDEIVDASGAMATTPILASISFVTILSMLLSKLFT